MFKKKKSTTHLKGYMEINPKVLNLPSNTSSYFGTDAFILQLRENLLHYLPRVLDLIWGGFGVAMIIP
jgi:hypothetical protein